MRQDFKALDNTKKVFVTGAAGFIGFHLCRELLERNFHIIGLDNLNSYYEVKLKEDRLSILFEYDNFEFVKGDLSDHRMLQGMFHEYEPDIVVNLGAQAGVRYSIENPKAYMQSNVIGFFNMLESCRNNQVEHLIYASSSSVYGANKKVPFSTEDKADHPVSFYAATKKTNELMAYSYCKLYGIPATGLRFFTVYGPWGRPDMAYFSFTKKILAGEAIKVYNYGDMYRDFTYIDDIVQGILNMLCNPPQADENSVKYKVYNIGNNKPEQLMHFIGILEHCLGKKAIKEFYPMQSGDVSQTYADVSDLVEDFDFKPNTPIEVGLQNFTEWFKAYYFNDIG